MLEEDKKLNWYFEYLYKRPALFELNALIIKKIKEGVHIKNPLLLRVKYFERIFDKKTFSEGQIRQVVYRLEKRKILKTELSIPYHILIALPDINFEAFYSFIESKNKEAVENGNIGD